MSKPADTSITELMQRAVAQHQAGHIAEARQLYRQVLSLQPDHVDALHYSAFAAQQQGDTAESMTMFQRAIALQPENAALHCNFGELLRATGKVDEAIESYNRALALKPNLAAAMNNLASALRMKGDIDGAIREFRRAVSVVPVYAEAYCNLGEALMARQDFEGARAALERSVQLKPRLPQAWNNLGNLLKRSDLHAAAQAYSNALAAAPNFVAALNNLGTTLQSLGSLDQAEAALRRALELNPASPGVRSNLALVLSDKGLVDQAIEQMRIVVANHPDFVHAQNNLALAHIFRGEYDEAVAIYRQLIAHRNDLPDVHSSLLLTLNYRARPEQMLAEHVNWARIYASPAREMAHTNSPDPNRRLRIGYVSADFRDHAMAHFVEPILLAHDRANDDVFCYSSVAHPDDVTRRLKSYGHTWRAIGGMSDEKVAAQIHSDSIDILVDLGGHTADSRLLVFAHKPAPIQITWLGYPNTSGLATMDYWITDGWLDPPGQTERFCTERLLRLPETFACYAPPRDAPPVNELPAEKNGFVTFVSFNNLIKLGEDVLELWSELLREIQSARLVIATQRLADGNGLGPFTERCRKAGMPMDRIRFLGGRQTVAYLKSHHEMDIALDSFPFTGHTITLHALWMGLPVITLEGNSHVSCRGVSVMQNLGLPELIAQTPDDYVRIAKDLAADLDRLANLRATLRERMRAAPLTDAPRFAKNLSAAFRAIWTNWCESRG